MTKILSAKHNSKQEITPSVFVVSRSDIAVVDLKTKNAPAKELRSSRKAAQTEAFSVKQNPLGKAEGILFNRCDIVTK